jgi:predicted nuclease of predicted toxin-antitoxin system
MRKFIQPPHDLFCRRRSRLPLVDLLRKYFTVIYAADEMPGASDDVILQQAFKNHCILITKDKDFGEILI